MPKIGSGGALLRTGYSTRLAKGAASPGGAMTDRQRLVTILIGVAGAIASFATLAGFLRKIMRNGLALPDAPTTQAYYKTVGAAYSDGFVSGFALCFFLTLLAVAIGTWFESRRKDAMSSAPSAALPEPTPR